MNARREKDTITPSHHLQCLVLVVVLAFLMLVVVLAFLVLVVLAFLLLLPHLVGVLDVRGASTLVASKITGNEAMQHFFDGCMPRTTQVNTYLPDTSACPS